MGFLIILVVFVGGGWLLGKIIAAIFFPKKNDIDYPSTDYDSKTIINNYTTENHLHISNKELKELIESKSNK